MEHQSTFVKSGKAYEGLGQRSMVATPYEGLGQRAVTSTTPYQGLQGQDLYADISRGPDETIPTVSALTDRNDQS